MRGSAISGIAAYVLALTLGGECAVAVQYGILDIGALSGPQAIEELSMNDDSQVVGASSNRAFIWDAANGMRSLGTLGGSFSQAFDINASGQVVGDSATSGGPAHAFLWDQDRGMQDIGALTNGISSYAKGMNDAGQAVGYSFITDGFSPAIAHAFFWDAALGMQDIGTIPTGDYSYAAAINNTGRVVGWSGRSHTYFQHTFLWDSMLGMQDLGVLSGSVWSIPSGINDLGEVVGASSSPYGPGRAFIWDSTNGMQELLGLAGGHDASALAVNNGGQVVGSADYYTGGPQRAVVWYGTSVAQELNDLIPPNSGWNLYEATDVNDRGQIIGRGSFGGKTHAFLLTPAPSELLPGDVNYDGFVNIFDVNLVSAHWGESGLGGDANGDGVVNIFDVNLISAHWTVIPGGGMSTAVPEPCNLVLAAIGLAAVVSRARSIRRR